MVRRVSREMKDTAGQVPQLELLIVLEETVKGLLEGGLLESINRRERLLHLRDSLSDTDRDVSAQLTLEVLCGSKMVSVCMSLSDARESMLDMNTTHERIHRTECDEQSAHCAV